MINNRIATMPQLESDDRERIATMPQLESDDRERIATMPQLESDDRDRIATMPQLESDDRDRIATLPQQGSGLNPRVVSGGYIIEKDTVFTGMKGGTYVVEANRIISADSGESQIYGCLNSEGNESYVARILVSITPESNIEKRKIRDRVVSFLDSISNKENSHILPLIDYGIIHVAGKEYYVEIYPYCEGGDLGSRKGRLLYSEIRDQIVPAVNEALCLFHAAGFVHRDIKPENLYYYRGKVVIGDFGITCDLREDGFATDKYKTGTLGYYAPELMSQAAVKASDYYSFGQTLWTLYQGEMMYQNILRRYRDYGIEEQRNQINFAMMNSVYYGLDEIGKDESFFEILIRGLLQYDPGTRFNYNQVCRWLKNDKSLAREISKFDSKAIFTTPFIFYKKECWDNLEIYETLIKHWDHAKELLYSGVIKDFYMSQDYGMASEINEIIKEYSTLKARGSIEVTYADIDYHNDVGLSRFFMLLNQGTTLVWKGTEYHSFANLSYQIGDYLEKFTNYLEEFENNAEITNLLACELLGYWYQLKTQKSSKYDQAMVDAMNQIRTLARNHTKWAQKVAYAAAYYLFTENQEEVIFQGCNSLEELALQITSKEYSYQNIYNMIHHPYFYGFLLALGYEESAFYMMNDLGNNVFREIEMFYDFFASQVKDRNIMNKIVECYRDQGPYVYLSWWKNHLHLYEFHGMEAKEIKKEIEQFVITGTTIDQVREQYVELSKLAIRFRTMFVDNIFLAQMGFAQGKDQNGITSKHMEAYWHYNLLEREVPIGFGKAQGMREVQCG